MKTHEVFAEVVSYVQIELESGAAELAPWAHLEPALLLGQLIGLLRDQVNGLRPPADASNPVATGTG